MNRKLCTYHQPAEKTIQGKKRHPKHETGEELTTTPRPRILEEHTTKKSETMSREPQEIKTIEQYHALLSYIAEERRRRGIDNRTEDEKITDQLTHAEILAPIIKRFMEAPRVY